MVKIRIDWDDKEQVKVYNKEYRGNNKEKIKELNRKYYEENKEKCLKINKRWRDNNKKRCIENAKKWRERNLIKARGIQKKYRSKNLPKHAIIAKRYRRKYPKKIKAHNIIHNKKIPLKPNCQICNSSERLEHHHPDYSKPELTITVCKKCHTKILYGGMIK